MDFLDLAAALAQPPDHALAGARAVGHDGEQFIDPLRAERLGGKRQLRLVAQRQLAQRFADREKAVIGAVAAVPGPIGHVDDLGPFLIGVLRLAVRFADQWLPRALGRRPHSRAESLGHVGADRELDHAKARVFSLAAIEQQLFLIARRVRTQRDCPHAVRQMAQAVFQDAQLLVSGGHVAVAELRIEHRALLRPPAVQRLIRLELLVAKQRLALVRLNQRRVHVQRRRGRGLTLLQKVQQRLVHPPETAQFLRHRRNERHPRDRLGRGWIIEPFQPARQRRRRGRRPLALAPPAAFQRPPFGARKQILLDRPQDRRKAAVALQPFDVFHAVAAGQIQENHRQNHLDVEPALAAGRPNMPLDRPAEAAGLDQVEIQGKPGQRRQSMAG